MKRGSLTGTIGCLAVFVLVIATSRGIRSGEQKTPKEPKDFSELGGLVGAYKDLYSRLTWLSNNLFRPGMILPFHGTIQDAEALAQEGWVVCDRRLIMDPLAAPRFRGKEAPDLKDKFLKGSVASGSVTGNATANTSVNGDHQHDFPASWYFRGLADGSRAGIDTNKPEDSFMKDKAKPKVQTNGNHTHQVTVDPPAFSVIYIMYVREPTAKSK